MSVESDLIDAEYKIFGKVMRHGNDFGDLNPILYQKLHGNQGSILIFVNVWEYTIPLNGKVSSTYEIDSSFECVGGHWVNLSIYTINAESLMSKLSSYEKDVFAVFKDMGGLIK